MSRTDKDRPFWVQINDPGNPVDHDHSHLGETVYGRKYLYNPDKSKVMVEEEFFATADAIIRTYTHDTSFFSYLPHPSASNSDGLYIWLSGDYEYYPSRTVLKAAHVTKGKYGGDTLMPMGKRTIHAYEITLLYTIPDHCTEGAKATLDNPWGWSREAPCTPTLPSHLGGWSLQSRNRSKAKTSIRRTRNGMSRVRARDTLKDLAKNWNAGEDIEDVEDRALPLTGQHRHSMLWDLY